MNQEIRKIVANVNPDASLPGIGVLFNLVRRELKTYCKVLNYDSGLDKAGSKVLFIFAELLRPQNEVKERVQKIFERPCKVVIIKGKLPKIKIFLGE